MQAIGLRKIRAPIGPYLNQILIFITGRVMRRRIGKGSTERTPHFGHKPPGTEPMKGRVLHKVAVSNSSFMVVKHELARLVSSRSGKILEIITCPRRGRVPGASIDIGA
jgi:hypothetical protein